MAKGRPRDRDPADTVATTWQVSLEQVRPTPGRGGAAGSLRFPGPRGDPPRPVRPAARPASPGAGGACPRPVRTRRGGGRASPLWAGQGHRAVTDSASASSAGHPRPTRPCHQGHPRRRSRCGCWPLRCRSADMLIQGCGRCAPGCCPTRWPPRNMPHTLKSSRSRSPTCWTARRTICKAGPVRRSSRPTRACPGDLRGPPGRRPPHHRAKPQQPRRRPGRPGRPRHRPCSARARPGHPRGPPGPRPPPHRPKPHQPRLRPTGPGRPACCSCPARACPRHLRGPPWSRPPQPPRYPTVTTGPGGGRGGVMGAVALAG